jgi:hypothetical protein
VQYEISNSSIGRAAWEACVAGVDKTFTSIPLKEINAI